MTIKLTSFPIKKFQKDNFKDENLEITQSNTESLWNDIRNHPLLKGRLVENVEFTFLGSFEATVEHRLNRIPRGYFVVKNNSNLVVYDFGMDKKFLYLGTDAAAKVSIWVF